VSDVKFVAGNLLARSSASGKHAGGQASAPVSSPVSSPKTSSDFETPWYLRFFVRDQPGIIANLAEILAAHHLNIDAVLQNPGFDKSALPFVITLEPCRDSLLHPALEKMSALNFAIRPCLSLPILR
jgi:homoserine dehydrogenase